MRKRITRSPRFAAVDNGAIDSLPSILSIGLLTRLIRAKDGEHVTVEILTQEYSEGESSLSRAMRELVEAGNVVKLKVQRAASEMVTNPDGSMALKRGGSWWTTFSVDSIPFTVEDVAQMLADLEAGGNVKSISVEPKRLDPRLDPAEDGRPAPRNPGVGQESAFPQVGPTPSFPGVGRPGPGRPTPGQAGALSKTVVSKTSSSSSPASSDPSETQKKKIDNENGNNRQAAPAASALPAPRAEQAADPAATSAPVTVGEDRESDAELAASVGRIVAAWTSARAAAGVGPHRRAGALEEFRASAAALVKAGKPVEWLVAVAAWMGGEQPAWTGLGEATKAQYAGAPEEPKVRAVARPDATRCPRHPVMPKDCTRCAREEMNARRDSEPASMDVAGFLDELGIRAGTRG